jgi:hypothetical protein
MNGKKVSEIEIPIAHYWLAAAYSEYASIGDWQSWADKLILNREKPEMWIIDMATAQNISDLKKILELKIWSENKKQGYNLSIGDAKLGYYYLLYEEEKYSIDKLLNLAGLEAEGGYTEIECEVFYSILNEYEDRLEKKKDIKDIEQKVHGLFSSLKKISENQWKMIQSFE